MATVSVQEKKGVSSAAIAHARPSSSLVARFFARPALIYLAAAALRTAMLLYGLWQDAHSPVKYTDIDYLVFTDAARFAATGQSPYARETYRYTPLLAWLLIPTAWSAPDAPFWSAVCFNSGKVLFAAADLLAGWFIERVLTMADTTARGTSGMDPARARQFAAIWLLNPMVATISTRGSSEGLLGVLVTALLWAVLARRFTLAGLLLGFGVHFKIYPFIYAPAIVWWMDSERVQGRSKTEVRFEKESSVFEIVRAFVTRARIELALVSLSTFFGLNAVMYAIYGYPFLEHTYFHHVTRIDHRHNFSPYNIQLYLTSAHPRLSTVRIESFAFLPQLLLACVLIPLVVAKKHLPTAMLAQTFAFVTFNKVCTSQYFLWYMVFLPMYLPQSSFLQNKSKGIAALLLWVVSQGLWLQQGFNLEFLGKSTFVPGLWLASLGFFFVNCWILGVIIQDTMSMSQA